MAAHAREKIVSEERRLLVVSHACVVAVNQALYLELAERGWDVTVVAPATWRHPYESGTFQARALPGLDSHVRLVPILLPGRDQRHVYLAAAGRLLRRARPHFVYLEEEAFSIPALQWGRASWRLGVPFAVQAAENLDRTLPLPARLIRSWILPRAAFVAARSPAAGSLAWRYGARDVALVPHAVPRWDANPPAAHEVFTIGYAGRLVAEKGVRDLVAAVERLVPPVRLVLVGDGPLRPELERRALSNGALELRTGVRHEDMPAAYAGMDVLVLPSRTTPWWAEQFGRVLVEALWCGIPIVGSSSGEIPWVVGATGGGRLVPERDAAALAATLADLRERPSERRALARQGRRSVQRLFSIEAVAEELEGALQGHVRSSAAVAA